MSIFLNLVCGFVACLALGRLLVLVDAVMWDRGPVYWSTMTPYQHWVSRWWWTPEVKRALFDLMFAIFAWCVLASVVAS